VHSALHRSPPVLTQELFSTDFIDVLLVALVACEFAAGESEGAEDDGQSGAVA
jgi:hypothetical protein